MEIIILDDEIKEIEYIYDSSDNENISQSISIISLNSNSKKTSKNGKNGKNDKNMDGNDFNKSEESLSVKSTIETPKKPSLKKKSLFLNVDLHKKIHKT